LANTSTPVGSMAELSIGVVAESGNDCEVIRTLIGRIFETKQIPSGKYKVIKRAGEGCSKLRRKAERWMRELSGCGCSSIILVHDCDRHDEASLRAELHALAVPEGIGRFVCIPIEEIEAWFFSSERALHLVCGDRARSHPSPHLISSPKEKLIDLSRGANRKPRYSPNDNVKLAEVLELDVCAQRCPAFRELRTFLLNLVQAVAT